MDCSFNDILSSTYAFSSYCRPNYIVHIKGQCSVFINLIGNLLYPEVLATLTTAEH